MRSASTLRVDLHAGLPDVEAEARLERDGPNEVPKRALHPLGEFPKKFWGLSLIEACGLLAIGWQAFDLGADDEALP